MSETVTLCKTDELVSGEARRFDVAGHRIALVRIGDEFHAVDDECSHEDYSLAEGLIVRGFFDAIIERGPIPEVTPLLQREVHRRLDSALGEHKVPAHA